MSDELDPEILADMRLRDATERERPRRQRAPVWEPPVIVAQWSCRNRQCRKPVDVPADAADRWAAFNEILRARGESPIGCDEVMVCDDCVRLVATHRAAKLAERRDRLAKTIRALKASRNPTQERELIKQLEADKHPEIPALLEAIANRRKQPGAKLASKGDA